MLDSCDTHGMKAKVHAQAQRQRPEVRITILQLFLTANLCR